MYIFILIIILTISWHWSLNSYIFGSSVRLMRRPKYVVMMGAPLFLVLVRKGQVQPFPSCFARNIMLHYYIVLSTDIRFAKWFCATRGRKEAFNKSIVIIFQRAFYYLKLLLIKIKCKLLLFFFILFLLVVVIVVVVYLFLLFSLYYYYLYTSYIIISIIIITHFFNFYFKKIN